MAHLLNALTTMSPRSTSPNAIKLFAGSASEIPTYVTGLPHRVQRRSASMEWDAPDGASNPDVPSLRTGEVWSRGQRDVGPSGKETQPSHKRRTSSISLATADSGRPSVSSVSFGTSLLAPDAEQSPSPRASPSVLSLDNTADVCLNPLSVWPR